MKKILLSGFVNILCALDVSAMLDPSLEAQNTPVTKILKYSELSEQQTRMLHPVPTEEKIELAYSPEALGFLDKTVATGVFTNSNPFQAQFLNIFSANELNRIAKNSFDAHVSLWRKGLGFASFGYFSPSFQEIKGDMLVGLLFAGWYSLSDDPKEQHILYARMEAVQKGLSANNQPYFNDVVRYLRDTVLETLNYEGFKRIDGLIRRKNSIYDLFSRYEIEDIAPSNNNKGAIVKASKKNFAFEQYQPMFSQTEWAGLKQCSDQTQKDALMIRTADMAGIAAMQVIETKKEVNTLKNQLKKDRETAQEIVTNLQEQLKEQKEENRTLEQRISALETATTKKEQEEKPQLMNESKQVQESKEPTEEKKQQEGSFISTGHRELGSFKFGIRWKYNGEIVKLGNDNIEAEGKGEFTWGALKIIGSFSHNRLDLSNAIIKREDIEVPINSVGYFNLENIKKISGRSGDKEKQQITANMPDGSKYIFSPNLIQFVTKDGQISEFIAER